MPGQDSGCRCCVCGDQDPRTASHFFPLSLVATDIPDTLERVKKKLSIVAEPLIELIQSQWSATRVLSTSMYRFHRLMRDPAEGAGSSSLHLVKQSR